MAKTEEKATKPKAPARTIEQRIEELKAVQERRDLKAAAKKQSEFTELSTKFDKQLDALVVTAHKLFDIATAQELELPDGIVHLGGNDIHVGTDVEITSI